MVLLSCNFTCSHLGEKRKHPCAYALRLMKLTPLQTFGLLCFSSISIAMTYCDRESQWLDSIFAEKYRDNVSHLIITNADNNGKERYAIIRSVSANFESYILLQIF